jgi:hypothetical protein
MSSDRNPEAPVIVTSYVETTIGQIIQVYLNNVVVTLSKKYRFDPHEAKDYINRELAPEEISTEINAYDFADEENSKTQRKRQKAMDTKSNVVKRPDVVRKRNSNKNKDTDLSLDFSKIALSPAQPMQPVAPAIVASTVPRRIQEPCSYIC